MNKDITPGSIWRHYDGNVYKVICVATMEATDAELVIYRNVLTSEFPAIWASPISEWQMLLTVTDGALKHQIPRFTLIPQ